MANPLTLLMPVIPGTSLIGIASALEGDIQKLHDALTDVGTVHYARTLLLDRSQPNLQPVLSTITASDNLLIGIVTEYDGSFDDYIQDFVNKVGPIFDKLMTFVVGGPALVPVANNVAAFKAYLKANDA